MDKLKPMLLLGIAQELCVWSLVLWVKVLIVLSRVSSSCWAVLFAAIPGHTVDIVDEKGNVVPTGQIGHIAVKAPDPVLFLQYWKNRKATEVSNVLRIHTSGTYHCLGKVPWRLVRYWRPGPQRFRWIFLVCWAWWWSHQQFWVCIVHHMRPESFNLSTLCTDIALGLVRLRTLCLSTETSVCAP